MSKPKTALFIRFSSNPQRALDIADDYGYFHKNELTEDKVQGLMYYRYKEIFVPATRDYPDCLRFIHYHAIHSRELLMRGYRHGRAKKVEYISGPVSEHYAEPIMEQAMERVRMKRLPCYQFSRRSFYGRKANLLLMITLDSVTDCPKAMQGSYLTLSGYGFSNYSLAELRSACVSIVGATQYSEPGCDYEGLLKQQFPKFPWTWTKSGK